MTNINAVEPTEAMDDYDRYECCDPAAFKAHYFREGPNTFAEHMAFPDAMHALRELARVCPHLPFKSWFDLKFNFSNDDETALRETETVVEALRTFATWLEAKAEGYSVFASEDMWEHVEDTSDMALSMGDHFPGVFMQRVGKTWRLNAINLWDTCVSDDFFSPEEDELVTRTITNLFCYLGVIGHWEHLKNVLDEDLHEDD